MKASSARNSLSKADIEQLIEHKLLELIGDPDSGLQLKKSFVHKLTSRLKAKSERISHQAITL